MTDDEAPEGEADPTEEQLLDAGELDSSEEGFLKGYSADDEVVECNECGTACREEKRIIREINEEKHIFCSKTCADEYEESLAKEE